MAFVRQFWQSASTTLIRAGLLVLLFSAIISNLSCGGGSTAPTGPGGGSSSHSVTLTWNASTSQVMGYIVYRRLANTTSFSVINGSNPTPSINYVDTDVQAGQSLVYVITSVDSNWVQSVPSSEVAVTVPSQ